MKIALLEFGNLYNFNKRMSNNLSLLENNIIELNKFFNHAELDIYILTDVRDDDGKSVSALNETLHKHNVTLKLLNFWGHIKDQWKEQEQYGHDNYINTFNIKQYGFHEDHPNKNPHGFDCKKDFNAGNLWFRRYLNYHLFMEYNKTDHTEYDFICMTRLFSTKIIYIKDIGTFDKNCLYYSLDNFFMGNYENMEKFFNFGKYSLFYNTNNHNHQPSLLDNRDFINFAKTHDAWWGDHIFSSEVQILYYIYSNFNNYKNLRFNYALYCHSYKYMCDLVYQDVYDDSEQARSILNKENASLFIVISR
jgi:hypothetical protein